MIDWINDLFENDYPPTSTDILPRGMRSTLLQLLLDCKALYESAARRAIYGQPEHIEDDDKFEELMLDLHKGVLVKVLVQIAHCDRRWNQAERQVAMLVLRHVWGVDVSDGALTKALENVVKHAEVLKWKELVRPFVDIPILRDDRQELRSILLRVATIVAKADGQVSPAELTQLELIRDDVTVALGGQSKRPQSGEPIQDEGFSRNAPRATVQVAELVHSADKTSLGPSSTPSKEKKAANEKSEKRLSPAEREKMFQLASEELNRLIGMDAIKSDINQLVDFIKVQQARREHQLPTAEISFHAVFEGNPGTGKTTVARILSRLLCGLGILELGQTIEADRSGLVAQFAGQTGPRTNERVDEALGGVLFLDEAYSLVSDRGEDAYGIEAVQTLLKRMEDDRDRFVVVIAGYPDPMRRMLSSNPGLNSRFQRTFTFPDYNANELLRIFFTLCKRYHYQLPKSSRLRLLEGFQRMIEGKDESFGNGRLARNVFEDSIRRMSTRIVGAGALTKELLTTILPEDIVFPDCK